MSRRRRAALGLWTPLIAAILMAGLVLLPACGRKGAPIAPEDAPRKERAAEPAGP